ncbi:MAG: DNA primase [Ruminococcus sp.]|nr:DNA primase [Ruminococcus sp.]
MAGYEEFTLELRNANPIDSVISSYVQLKKRGRTLVCNCPFHSEKTPSFTVYPDTQSFYCFGCGAGGDVITFTMKAENLDFIEAVRLLAERSGMALPERNSNAPDNSHRRTRIYEMNRITANFFYKNLVSGRDKTGLDYFKQRQLSAQTIKKFGLGYASDSWDELCTLLTSKGYSENEILDAWLGGRSQKNGRIFDMFRKRVMFPIVDMRGNVIGFGGRVLDDSKPKYLNTSKTLVFDKGSNLFAMNFAKDSDSKHIILCEGYMDVIAVNQAGFDNAVATLGTAITPDQARLLSRYAEEVIIAYDSDGAGQAATRKAISHFSDVGLRTRILHMDGAKDPDEYIKKFGVQRFRMLIDKSNDANNFLIDRCENELDIETEAGKVELLKRVSKVLADIPSALEREVYISRTAKKYDFPVDVLKAHIDSMMKKNSNSDKKNEWNQIKIQTAMPQDKVNPEAVKHKKEAKAEETIICQLLRHPEDAVKIRETAPPEIFVTDFYKRVYEAILSNAENTDNFSLVFLSEVFSPEEVGKIHGIRAKNLDITINAASISACADVLKNHHPVKSAEELTDEDVLNAFSKKRH